MAREQITLIRVANKKAERTGKFKLANPMEEVYYGKALTNDKNWKKVVGDLGLMTREDFNNGNFAPYGIKESDVKSNQEIDSLKATNAELQRKNAELAALLEAKGASDEGADKGDTVPPEKNEPVKKADEKKQPKTETHNK